MRWFNKQRLPWLGLAGLVAVGAYLRLTGLTTFSLWFDEWITVEQSLRPSLWEALTASGTHPPLLRLLVRGSVALFGDPSTPGGLDFAVRLPSALLGVAGIVFLYLFARRWSRGSEAVALVAAGFYAVCPYGLYYGQEARYYAGMVLFAAWSLHALDLLLESPRSVRRQVYLAAPLVLGLHNHHLFGLLFLLTFAAALPTLVADWRRRYVIVLPWVVAGLLFLPWFSFVMGHMEPQARPWLPDLPTQWHDTGVAFFTGRIGALHLTGSVAGPKWYKPLAYAAWLLLATGLAVHVVRRWSAPAWRTLLVVGLALGSTAALHAGGQTTKFFHHKYLAFLFPFVCLAVAELVVYLGGVTARWSDLRTALKPSGEGHAPENARLRRRMGLATAAWIAALAVTLYTGQKVVPATWEAFVRIRPGAARPFYKEPYRAAARWVEKRRGPHTLVVVWDPFRQRNNLATLRYYGVSAPVVIYKWHQLEHPVTFWAKFLSELADARDVIVVTAHCSTKQRDRVERTLAWGFSRRVHTERFVGAEGTIHATHFAPGPEAQ